MLSLNSGRKIAIIDSDKKHCVYLKDDGEGEPEIETTRANKEKIFRKYLEMDKKLSHSELEMLLSAFKRDEEVEGKLNRKYHIAKEYVNDSLKRYLDYGSKTLLFPVVEEPSYRLFVSGLSGSGKSHFISEFVKVNKPKTKGAGIFLFSPVENDKSMTKIKNLIHLNLDDLEAEMKGKELTVEDIPEGSIVIFDDIESYQKHVAKRYMELRDIFLERGRHRDISTICVSHNAMNGHATKVSIREAQYWCLFPKFNARDSKVILKTYGGFEKNDIDEIMNMKSRWVFVRKSVPKYAVGEHGVIAF
jgi:hypothetical protein